MNKVLKLVAMVVAAIIVWNLLEFFYCSVITKTGYAFSWRNGVFRPVIFAVVLWILDLIFPTKKKDN